MSCRIFIPMLKLITAAILVSPLMALNAQTGTGYAKVDRIMSQLPGSSANSSPAIANYISANFSSQPEKVRAIYFWIASNIRYDVENMFAARSRENAGEIIREALRNKKGVCVHYSELFHDLAGRVGIKSYVISGYTKQDGVVDHIPHAWCAAQIDGLWFLFDPTWGAGYVQGGKFIPQLTESFFKVPPQHMIHTHMPFDPMWQFLYYPLTHQEFVAGKPSKNRNRQFFSYPDTLAMYENQAEVERLVSSVSRIERNGAKNALVHEWLSYIENEIEYFTTSELVDHFNAAINLYNEGISRLNRFIDYRNSHFTPGMTDAEIWKMLVDAENSLELARSSMRGIKNPDPGLAKHILRFYKSIDEAMGAVREQRSFLEKYLSTPAVKRISLFYETIRTADPRSH